MTCAGCAGSLLPTRLSLQSWEMQGDFAKLQGKRRPIAQHLRALGSPLPTLTSRENRFHSREATGADKVFGTHKRYLHLDYTVLTAREALG